MRHIAPRFAPGHEDSAAGGARQPELEAIYGHMKPALAASKTKKLPGLPGERKKCRIS